MDCKPRGNPPPWLDIKRHRKIGNLSEKSLIASGDFLAGLGASPGSRLAVYPPLDDCLTGLGASPRSQLAGYPPPVIV